ncbi:MAG: septum formation initiator family protein [Patescibacteria group bacterium]|jgi:cell division protein FtsB
MNNQFQNTARSRGDRKSHWKTKIWSSNIFSILLIVLLIVSFVKVGKEIILRFEIKREINTLQVQLEDLQNKTAQMDKLISYLKTDDYIEKQARLELNLSRPGEKQVNLINLDNLENKNALEYQGSNIEKWFNYFFD